MLARAKLIFEVLWESFLGLALVAPGDGAAAEAAVTGPLPPDTTITFGPIGWTNLTRPVYGYESNNPDASFECRLDSEPFEPCGPATYEVLEGHPGEKLSGSTHTIEVRAVGPDGEVDPTPARAVIMVDADPPTATIVSGPTGVTHQRRPRFRLRVAGEDSFWCRILSKGVRIKVRTCDGPTSFRAPRPLAEGNYVMIVIAFDRAGNETEDRIEFSVRTKPGPPPNPFRDSILYSGRNHGVKTVFRLKGDKLIQARISIPLVCTGEGRRYRSYVEGENATPSRPIVLNKRGELSHRPIRRRHGGAQLSRPTSSSPAIASFVPIAGARFVTRHHPRIVERASSIDRPRPQHCATTGDRTFAWARIRIVGLSPGGGPAE